MPSQTLLDFVEIRPDFLSLTLPFDFLLSVQTESATNDLLFKILRDDDN